MTDNKQQPTRVSDRALEMVMRDVLDGLMELSLVSAYGESNVDFEIIAIEPADNDGHDAASTHQEPDACSADIISFPQLRKAAG
jgi:hypothetical protein